MYNVRVLESKSRNPQSEFSTLDMETPRKRLVGSELLPASSLVRRFDITLYNRLSDTILLGPNKRHELYILICLGTSHDLPLRLVDPVENAPI